VKRTSASKAVASIILAAGKGTRMRSAQAKVLHRLLGVPLVSYAVECAQGVGSNPIVAVLGHQREAVEATLVARHGADAVTVVEQAEQKGTGHAVRLGLAPLKRFDGVVLILCGDVPLLRAETCKALVARAQKTGGLAMLTAHVPDPTGYGRIRRDPKGRVLGIVEHKDATDEERAITEINAGVYAAPAEFLRTAVGKLQTKNAQGEYYLTDIVAPASRTIGVTAVVVDHQEVAGINDRRQLVEAEKVMNARLVLRLSEQATFRDPATTVVEPGVTVGADVEIGRNVALRGRTTIADGAVIGDGVILVDTQVGPGAEIKPYCVASEAVIGAGAKIGPFAHLRPGTDLGPDVHVGNFVETKKTRMGRGSKANHLTYLGDAVIGEKVNVGAGTITCNYNGYEKSQTVIEDGAFIGSDTQLVAPVTVRRGAIVAAGATIVKDVPEGALAISRPEQVTVAGYAERLASRYAGKSRGKSNGVSSAPKANGVPSKGAGRSSKAAGARSSRAAR
jgi:bifunctional UDP-N-acetylglucosamine pyrophosphorylase/glucosamine-1-phosphate N-acetyltransferase